MGEEPIHEAEVLDDMEFLKGELKKSERDVAVARVKVMSGIQGLSAFLKMMEEGVDILDEFKEFWEGLKEVMEGRKGYIRLLEGLKQTRENLRYVEAMRRSEARSASKP